MDTVLITVGAAAVLLALADVFLTVLYARIGVGLLTPTMYRLTWSALKAVSPIAGKHKDFFLTFGGPLMMAQTVALWFLLLLFGFALICWPPLGTEIQASSGGTPTDFWASLYYSGYSLTTLGTGDLVPKTSAYRVLMVVQAAIGFSVLTLTLTYFMSVYSALVRRNTLAQMLHHLSARTGDAATLVIGLCSGDAGGTRSQLTDLGARVLDLLESHHSYPVLHYFRMRDPRYAMAKVAYLTLETATLIRVVLGPAFDGLKNSAAVNLLWGSGTDLLKQTKDSLLKGQESGDAIRLDDSEHFEQSAASLNDAGLETSDKAHARQAYMIARQEWVVLARTLARHMSYDWTAMEPCNSHGHPPAN